ncbi:MAG TPA: EAL domain-containing protein [Terracidiphilus sp.]|nr:EAL domain-containing protein [Terracidiphilus sp.]
MGVLASLPIALSLQAKIGENQLHRYSERILHVETMTAQETGAAIEAISGDGLPFCSDAELAAMRDFVFNGNFVRDIGRIKGGALYCTAVQGRLPAPVPIAPGDFSLGHAQVRRSRPLSLISPRSNGIIIYDRDISVVLNSGPLDALDQTPLLSTGLVFDHAHSRVFQAYGHNQPLTDDEVTAQRLVLRQDVYYLPLCSARYAVCVVAAEPRREMFLRTRADLAGFLGDGLLLGSAVTAIVLLFVHRQRSLERRLRLAIRRRQLTCVYQPIVDLDTGACVGAEALARWATGTGGFIPPDVFVRIAEQKGFVTALSRLVVDLVLKDLGSLLLQPNFRVAVNIAPHDLADPRFFAHLEKAVASSGTSPRSLAFELTEHSTVDPDMAEAAIARLRQQGYAVYIDDFGTGYSSLAYLQRLHVDAIKVDRAFTHTVGTEAVTASVLPQILEIARRLGLTVIAEGIENQEQAEYFRTAREGVLGQGWFFGRPVPAEEFKTRFAPKAPDHAMLEQTPIPDGGVPEARI